jgi:AraC-like DNA-binding protein
MDHLPKFSSVDRPLIVFDGARAVYLGPALGLKPHRNAAFTLAIGLDAPVSVTLSPGPHGEGENMTGPIVPVPAGRHHHLQAEGQVGFLYLDGLSDDVSVLTDTHLRQAHRRIASASREALRDWPLAHWRAELGVTASDRADPRATSVARLMFDDPERFPSLAEAARAAALSPSRFHHIFRQEIGAPFRRYRLWRRMGLAMAAIGDGANLTAAAHEAGFSSSAHFSSQFTRMFGLSPSSLVALRPEIRAQSVGERNSGSGSRD